ncbi:hypothetical protein H0H87_008310 [Tephrocybe sp. NHM501043]|nr:hypothetical protein H0H87_008310 [Tephrocybe sp. NHM501043]
MPGDVVFNSNTTYFGSNITDYVNNGTIPESRVDDMATRILAAWYLLKQDSPSYPKVNFDAFLTDNEATNEHIDVQDDHYKIVREIGAASTVLLKNVKNALPLKKPRSIVLVGSDAGPGKIGPNEFGDQGGQDGILAMGWGSGTSNFTYLVSVSAFFEPSMSLTDGRSQPLEALQQRARKDRTSVSWFLDDFNLARAGNVVRFKSAALVFINSDSGEDYITVDGNEGDRKNLTAWHGGDKLVAAVAAQNKNTIVIVHSVGPLIVEPWIDHPNVTAVLWAGLSGQEAGNSITDVIYGDYNPSGRLPYTIAKQVSDYSAQLLTGGGPNDILAIPYTEGLEIDYRHFDAKNITPRFEFGFGLSYTTFAYSNLKISTVQRPDSTESNLINAWEAGKASPIGQGSSTALWPAYLVTFDIKNTGSRSGIEIPQLYLNMPISAGEPPSILKGFTDIEVAPGKTETVTINLSRYDLSIWDTVAQGWRKPKGTIKFTIGASSRDAPSSTGLETSTGTSSGIPVSITSLASSSVTATSSSSDSGSAAPIQSPVPGVFPATDPKNPPSIHDSDVIIPDFGPAWSTAYTKAKAKIASFSLEELASVATGVQSTGISGRCVGNIPPVEPATGRGWPGLCLEDSPLGVRLADFVTAFPTGINTAATFVSNLWEADLTV